ncbi:MAG: hypothetical protein ACYC2Y_03025 [Armatimonadota bacterium]
MGRQERVLGYVIFALGIIGLIFVFFLAERLFSLPASEVLSQTPSGIAGLGGTAVVMAVRIALLFVMTYAASSVAGRGVQLIIER